MRTFFAPVLLLLVSLGMACAELPGDAPGAKDFPGVPRYEGSKILFQSEQAYGEFALQIKGLAYPDSTNPKEVRLIEGQLHRTTYVLENTGDARRSALEVMRNYQKTLTEAGFKTGWEGSPQNIANGPPMHSYYPESAQRGLLTGINSKERRYFWAEKEGQYAAVFVTERAWDFTLSPAATINPFKRKIDLKPGTLIIQVDFVTTTPMEEKMVLVKAEEMQSKISDTGHIALYGIYFDFNKADLKPESDPTLTEIATLLTAKPDLKLLIVGHTDNVGTYEFNQTLSLRRAEAVVAALKEKHRIAPNRLTPYGASFIAPVDTNTTEEGRAKNRRVVLVEQ